MNFKKRSTILSQCNDPYMMAFFAAMTLNKKPKELEFKKQLKTIEGTCSQNDRLFNLLKGYQKGVLSNMFQKLPTVEKTKVNKGLLKKDLKQIHISTIMDMFNSLLSDSNVTHVNEFESWTNQYLAQLVSSCCINYIVEIEDIIDKITGDKRQLSNLNTLRSLKDRLTDIGFSKTVKLVEAKISKQSYPLSKEGITLVEECSNIFLKYTELKKRIIHFSKLDIR